MIYLDYSNISEKCPKAGDVIVIQREVDKPTENKRAQREELDADVEAFLSRGGKITTLPSRVELREKRLTESENRARMKASYWRGE